MISPVVGCSATAFTRSGSVVGLAQDLCRYLLRPRSGGRDGNRASLQTVIGPGGEECLVVFFLATRTLKHSGHDSPLRAYSGVVSMTYSRLVSLEGKLLHPPIDVKVDVGGFGVDSGFGGA